ncbi:methyl-CpG-binding domain-containing protein 4-like [Iris pallida]|nr:methyl-CpG-binding domain-containing protein 4-like [Iris pallida]
MPNGKRVRSTVEVEKFLETYPEYKDQFSVSNFSFATPKILEDMVPGNSAGSNKKRRTETEK